MSKAYKNIRPKKHFVYNVEDLMHLYGVTRDTISNWVAEGLRRSDSFTPHVFNGAEVKRFHEAKRLASKATLRIGQFKCFKCKERIFPDLSSLDLYPPKNDCAGVWGQCPNCNCVVQKRVNETDWDKILNCVITNTTLMSLDEGYEQAPKQDADAWKGLSPVEFLTRIFEVWIMAQHAYWAVGRGLADARSRGKQILRLKVVMDEGGWTLTAGTTKQGNPPEPTPDRLETAISLLNECSKLT